MEIIIIFDEVHFHVHDYCTNIITGLHKTNFGLILPGLHAFDWCPTGEDFLTVGQEPNQIFSSGGCFRGPTCCDLDVRPSQLDLLSSLPSRYFLLILLSCPVKTCFLQQYWLWKSAHTELKDGEESSASTV